MGMKIETHLDYQTILANQARPIHFALRFTADEVAVAARRPAAFCVVLDRSGSMEGRPLDHALTATRTAIKNLRKEDHFALVVFDARRSCLVRLARQTVKRERIGLVSIETLDRLAGRSAGGGA